MDKVKERISPVLVEILIYVTVMFFPNEKAKMFQVNGLLTKVVLFW